MLRGATLCYVMLCDVMWCYVVLRYATLCYVVLCGAMWCYVMLRYAMWCYVMLRGATWCYVVLCGATLCCVMLRSATLCYVVLRGATLCYVVLRGAMCFICGIQPVIHFRLTDSDRRVRKGPPSGLTAGLNTTGMPDVKMGKEDVVNLLGFVAGRAEIPQQSAEGKTRQ
ncbi:hypothetical protein BV898_19066 [Hypsibius exemplaris]|uniref:Uncharacterized protein n=1 Tax=Hypsibius exemplaris TaxID=2072580 RepID=A0A9X6RP46_HYPEX|nr:hypothetical protein BV898_19066 [Hypsibius exemplaris]